MAKQAHPSTRPMTRAERRRLDRTLEFVLGRPLYRAVLDAVDRVEAVQRGRLDKPRPPEPTRAG